MIGVLFRANKLRRMLNGKEPYENISFYKNLAKDNEVDTLFYTYKSIKVNRVTGYHYSYQNNSVQRITTQLPKVNLIRMIIPKKYYHLLKKIEQNQQVVFANLNKGRDKYRIYQFLKRIKSISQHIPGTERLTYRNLTAFLEMYPAVVVKPVNGAQGEKIYLFEKKRKHYLIRYTIKRRQYKKVVHRNKLFAYYKKRFSNKSRFLVQEYIPFETYQGDKYDIRTSVQKDKNGQWKLTGIVTRVADRNGIVTNVAQGGRVVSYHMVKPTLSTCTQNRIEQLSMNVAKELERVNPSTMDLGLDIAIDKEGKLWFIEANYCDQRYAYREAKDHDMWEACYRTPFEYAYGEYIRLEKRMESIKAKEEQIKEEQIKEEQMKEEQMKEAQMKNEPVK